MTGVTGRREPTPELAQAMNAGDYEAEWFRRGWTAGYEAALTDAARSAIRVAGAATPPAREEPTALSDAEVETIYAAFEMQTGYEARSIEGRRRIVEPIYEAVIAARIARSRE